MKINTILHPEVILGSRGSVDTRRFYRHMMSAVSLSPVQSDDGKDLLIVDRRLLIGKIEELCALDQNMCHHILMCQMYLSLNGRSYYVPKDFAHALSKIDRDLPMHVLPENFMAYFHFPEGCFTDDDGPVVGGYVFIGKGKHLGVNRLAEETLISLSYLNAMDPRLQLYQAMKFVEVAKAEKISTLMAGTTDDDPKSNLMGVNREDIQASRIHIIRALINASIYLHSQEPELLRLRPIAGLSLRKAKAYAQESGGNVNECTIPVTLLNWNYGQDRQYSVDSTMVQTHMRWQPCGVERKQVKLIWVKEHERHYKKGNEDGRTVEES